MPTNAQEDSKYLRQRGGYKLIETKESHLDIIASSMRQADQLEVFCMGKTPLGALQEAYEKDDTTLSILDKDDIPIAIFGVGQILDMAYIWLLGTDNVREASYVFLKESRYITQALVKPYGSAFNFVHAENKIAIKWLKFCGATFIRKLYFMNNPFYEFIITYKIK